MFDVTDPTNPRFLRFYRTACGSHTHTLVPDPKNNTMHAYVASYPLGSHITPQIDRPQSDPLGLTCKAPHSKISIVDIPLTDPENGTVRTKALSSDTEFYDGDGPDGHAPGFQSCHDHQAFLQRNIMVASLGRYIIPRAQSTQVCVSHNGNVLPTTDGSRSRRSTRAGTRGSTSRIPQLRTKSASPTSRASSGQRTHGRPTGTRTSSG